ncbi:MAG: 4Fe-4S binding protein [Planctomycetota bacterium]
MNELFPRTIRICPKRFYSFVNCSVVILILLAAPAFGMERFPRPEFESGHRLPVPAAPLPSATGWDILDVAVLIAAIALASFLALRKRSRTGILLLSIFSVLYFGFWRKGCVCPIGAIQNVTLAFSDPAYAIPWGVLAFFLIPLALTLFFGRTFCAAVCPHGALQDLVILRPVRIPDWLGHALGMAAYAYLGLAVMLVVTANRFIICEYDPFIAIFRRTGTTGMLALGAGLLLAGMFIARPYCRFFCPYGVILNWMSRFSQWHVTITPDECVQCALCETSCPFALTRRPVPERPPEDRQQSRRRLAVYIAILPVIVAAGGWAGRLLGAPLARLHASVALAEQIRLEEAGTGDMTPESEAFRGTGRSVTDLFREADAARAKSRLGGMILGIFLGLAFGLTLIALSTRRLRTDYEPDRAACFSCGRCFDFCPKERARWGKRE